jgi:CRP-like cAMP-binding protein
MIDMPTLQSNRLLAAAPTEARRRLAPYLELVHLPFGRVIHEPGHTPRHVILPTDCLVSLIYVTQEGDSTEISVVGNEGMVGISVFMGGDSTPNRAIVQGSGHAYRLSADRLEEEFNNDPGMRLLMLRYIQALITQVSQTVACNRHHSIDQRLCRWILLSLDRLPTNRLTMTHELIANMLGVRREGVTHAAGKLQQQNVIEYKRGHITVLDRTRLERLACECYAVVRNETDRLCAYDVAPDSRATPRFRTIRRTAGELGVSYAR